MFPCPVYQVPTCVSCLPALYLPSCGFIKRLFALTFIFFVCSFHRSVTLVKEKLVERMILTVDTQSEEALSPEGTSMLLVMTGVQSGLTFEQQLEILTSQSKEREFDRQLELEKMRVQERGRERRFEKFKCEQKIQEAKLAQEAERRRLGKIGRSVDSSGEQF